jgi:putative ABC transport system permease protein
MRTANIDILRSFEETVIAVAGRATLQVSGEDLGFDERLIERLRRHPGVISTMPVIRAEARVVDGPHRGAPLSIVALDLLEAVDLNGIRVQDPSWSFETLLSPDSVFIGHRLALEWSLEIGSPLSLIIGARRYDLIVQGLIEPESGLATAWDRMAVMDIAAAQALFGLVGRVDRIDLVTVPQAHPERIAEEIRAWLPPPLKINRPIRRNEQVEGMLRAFQFNLAMLSAVGLLVGLFLVYNTVSFSVVQRRREIGMLCALGFRRRAISALFMAEAAIIGLLGGLLGSWLGVVLARSLVALLSRTVADLYVPALATAGSSATSWLLAQPGVWFEGAAYGAAVSLLGAFSPSLEASRTSPARAVMPGEYESAYALRIKPLGWSAAGALAAAAVLAWPGPVMGLPLFGYASSICLLIGLSCLAPALLDGFGRVIEAGGKPQSGTSIGNGALWAIARLAGDQVARAPKRNAVTISAMMVGIAIMVGVGTMIGSFRYTVEVWIQQTVLADLVVAPTSWLQGEESGMLANRIPGGWADSIAELPEVAAVDPYREMTIEMPGGQPVALVARDLRLHGERSRYLFIHGDSTSTLNRARSHDGVLISEALARGRGMQSGETLRLVTPSGEREFPVEGVFYDYATDGGKIVLDRDLYRRLWHDDSTTVLAVYLQPDVDSQIARRRIVAQLRDLAPDSQPAVITNGELKKEILGIFDRTFTVTYALETIAVVISVLGIMNTLLTSVLERQRELATLRAIGASAGQIRTLLLWESGYLGVLAGVLGVIGGLLLAFLLIGVINKQSFGWTIQSRLSLMLLVTAVGLAWTAALLAGYFPARWAARQPIADGLRYE